MSRTTGNKIANDNYPTPKAVVDELLKHLVLRPGDTFSEPCRGELRVIYDAVDLPETSKSWAELSEGVDYLSTLFTKKFDVIITNPPFTLTTEFLTKSMAELAPDGTLVYLQRVNFLGSKCRVDFWNNVGFPDKCPVIVPRPRFVNDRSDSCEYAWFIWDKGNRFPTIPTGLSHLITKD